MENIIEIAEFLKASASPTDLLKPRGKFGMSPIHRTNNLFDTKGFLFFVKGENFQFTLSFDSTGLIVERNGYKCCLTPDLFPDRRLLFFLMAWSPNDLKLISGYKQNGKPKEVIQVVNTAPTIAPISLKRWARENSLIRKTIYKTEEEFRDSVNQCLADLKDKIEDSGSGESFWDYSYEGNKIISKSPKKESLAQLLFKPMLDTELFLRGIEIFRENTTPSGDIDFTVTGAVAGIGSVSMCIELKNAHSKELENGLLNQLPDYMRSQSSQYGAYCILNYNINGNRASRAELLLNLNLIQVNSNDPIVQSKIRIFLIDLDKEIVQSKRK